MKPQPRYKKGDHVWRVHYNYYSPTVAVRRHVVSTAGPKVVMLGDIEMMRTRVAYDDKHDPIFDDELSALRHGIEVQVMKIARYKSALQEAELNHAAMAMRAETLEKGRT